MRGSKRNLLYGGREDVLVEEAHLLFGGEAERGAEGFRSSAEDTATRAKEHLGGGIGENFLSRAGILEGVVDGGDEGFAIEGLEAELYGDSSAEGGVLLHGEASGEGWVTDKPEGEQVPAVKSEVQKT